MKILSGDQMALWDRRSIQRYGISARLLMERAARQCCRVLLQQGSWDHNAQVLIVCGPGNNGGDGLAMTHLLRREGIKAKTFFMGVSEKLSPEARYFYDKVQGDLFPLRNGKQLRSLLREIRKADILVDAIFGIGLSRPLGGLYKKTIAAMNRGRGFKLAVDIPSGLSSNTGEVLGAAFQADITVTFEVPKWGQILPPAWDYVGKLKVLPIGLSRKELQKFKSDAEWVEDSMVRRWLPRRSKAIHKGKAGQVLVVAGSSRMPGAGFLCAISALRAGAGLVRWVLPEEAFRKIELKNPEVILHPIASFDGKFAPGGLKDLSDLYKRFHALALGPGLGQGGALLDFIRGLLQKCPLPMVLDADALDLVAQDRTLLKLCKGHIFTPHPREMGRLYGKDLKEILQDPISLARNFAKKHHLWLVIKGYRSVMASPHGKVWINSSGGPNLATAGSGDVLTGIIVSLLAQGLKPGRALITGVFLHGYAGDILAQAWGDRGALASDLAKVIPLAIKGLLQ